MIFDDKLDKAIEALMGGPLTVRDPMLETVTLKLPGAVGDRMSIMAGDRQPIAVMAPGDSKPLIELAPGEEAAIVTVEGPDGRPMYKVAPQDEVTVRVIDWSTCCGVPGCTREKHPGVDMCRECLDEQDVHAREEALVKRCRDKTREQWGGEPEHVLEPLPPVMRAVVEAAGRAMEGQVNAFKEMVFASMGVPAASLWDAKPLRGVDAAPGVLTQELIERVSAELMKNSGSK